MSRNASQSKRYTTLLLSLSIGGWGACQEPAGEVDESGISDDDGSDSDPDASEDPSKSEDDDDTNNTPSQDGKLELCDEDDADIPGPRLLRRLTTKQFRTTMRSVFGLSESQWSGGTLPPDPAAANGFNNNAERLRVNKAFASAIFDEAQAIAGIITKDATQLQTLLPCASAGGGACAQEYLERYGRRLYRRPLSSDEENRYLELLADADSFSDWVYWTTVGLIQSPSTLYRMELGQKQGDIFELDGYEIATALSFGLLGVTPSDALLDRAKSGEFDDPEKILEAAQSLAMPAGEATPAFRSLFLDFVDQWLGLPRIATATKNAEMFPEFGEDVRQAMREESRRFFEEQIFERNASMSELLTARETFVNRVLVNYYGFGSASASGFEPVSRPDDWGKGMLAQGALLAITGTNDFSSPTKRGVLVRERILCGEVGSPPLDVPELPSFESAKTTRERYEKLHANVQPCQGCHEYFDPIGFGFEHLDSSGRYRAKENGYDIDAGGRLLLDDETVEFYGLSELADELAKMRQPSVCVASFMAGDFFGLDHHDTPCLATSLTETFADEDAALAEYYVKLVSAPHFRTRRAK